MPVPMPMYTHVSVPFSYNSKLCLLITCLSPAYIHRSEHKIDWKSRSSQKVPKTHRFLHTFGSVCAREDVEQDKSEHFT